jgi:basic membrane protein A and related proteins
MKKRWLTLATIGLVMAMLVGCGSNNAGSGSNSTGGDSKAKFKVGMVTDAGTIDDKSFNQGTWEGVKQAGDELGLEIKYLKPAGTTEANYLNEIANLYDAGFKFIVTPGFKFETAIYAAQDKYPDAKFVLIDGEPRNAEGESNIKENTVGIYYAEHESGFVAGVATAVELQEGALGFIGGMKIPPVQKFNWGFQQGVAYANENYGTKMTLDKDNIIYQGSFDNVSAGGQLAAQMYDKGVKAIFAAAGGVGVGAINEAKTRTLAGQEAWIIGVDVDQYADGIYEGNKSIILTSAMKKITVSTFDMIKAEVEGKFEGGKTIVFDAKNDGVGIPTENPNLGDEAVAKAKEALEKIKSGEIVVAAEQGSLVE